MFLFEPLGAQQIILWFVVLGGLILINELARMNKWFALTIFLFLPLVLTFTLWPNTATPESGVGTWFHWVKVYSALAGCLGFMALRYIKGAASNRYFLMFPPFILALNIFEAVLRDFQCYGFNGVMDGDVIIYGGAWNIMNGIAGLINMITITGWMGIFIGKDSKKDMLWPDMLWFWIIAYDIWNFAYVYNCVGNHAFYAGAALLISCTIPAFFIKRGAWLQHRAQTLAIWMMFTMSVPAFVSTNPDALVMGIQTGVKSSNNPDALLTVSGISLVVNIAVLVYQLYVMATKRRNPLKEELYVELAAYKKVAELK